MFAPGVPQVMRDFKSDNMDMASFIVSVYVLGYAFGPLVIAPMSELYGRNSIYYVSAIFFLIFSIGCAWSTGLVMLTAFRFLAGVAGCCPLTVGSGTIADTFKQEERGKVMGIWMFSILFGPWLVMSCSIYSRFLITDTQTVSGLSSAHMWQRYMGGDGISISLLFA